MSSFIDEGTPLIRVIPGKNELIDNFIFDFLIIFYVYKFPTGKELKIITNPTVKMINPTR